MIKPAEAKAILIADLENRKAYPARFDQDCPTCGEPIEEGDDLYFIGDKRMCDNCRIDLIDNLEDLT